MRTRLVAASLLTLFASVATAAAAPVAFTYTGAFQTFTVPTDGRYDVLAFGAQGGTGRFISTPPPGGRGAEIGGDFHLIAGERLRIAVGGVGSNTPSAANRLQGGGGGGGSFVVLQGAMPQPLVIAGGGGGGGSDGTGRQADGQTGIVGQNGFADFGDAPNGGGTNGAGGFGPGGGGFISSGGAESDTSPVLGGGSFPDGLGGGAASGASNGGFGGGGGASSYYAGGGGGYSGGGTGVCGIGCGSGGGGSFDGGANQVLVAGFNSGNGLVVITELPTAPVPEPASLAIFGGGLLGLQTLLRRRADRVLPIGWLYRVGLEGPRAVVACNRNALCRTSIG